jgi:hypothetical protein
MLFQTTTTTDDDMDRFGMIPPDQWSFTTARHSSGRSHHRGQNHQQLETNEYHGTPWPDRIALDTFQTNAGDKPLRNQEEGLSPSLENPFAKLLDQWNQLLKEGDDSSSSSSSNLQGRKEVYFAIQRQRTNVDADAITVAVHVSTQKLNRLLFLIQQWGGPTSAAIYITSVQDIKNLEDFYLEHGETTNLRWTDFHILLERPHPLGYPHNLLREMALQGIEDTYYFLALDVDFVPNPPNTYCLLQAQLRTDLHCS